MQLWDRLHLALPERDIWADLRAVEAEARHQRGLASGNRHSPPRVKKR